MLYYHEAENMHLRHRADALGDATAAQAGGKSAKKLMTALESAINAQNNDRG